MAVYNKNFLDKVIWRIDFEKIALANVAAFQAVIATDFPTGEQMSNEQVSVSIDAQTKNVSTATETALAWKFHAADRTKRVEIASQHCYIEFDHYIDSTDLLKCVALVESALIANFNLKEVSRFGLRYLNIIKLKDEADFSWSKYLHNDLLAGLRMQTVMDGDTGLARWMGNLIYNFESQSLNYKFGIWNQDFPANNVRKEFILDLDCRSNLPFEIQSGTLTDTAKSYNKIIEKAFEASITDGLRAVLNEE